LENLEKQLAKIQEQIAEEKKQLKEKAAKERKRQVEIIGAYYLEKAEKGNGLDTLVRELEAAGCLKKKTDRAIFGLGAEKKQTPTVPTTPKAADG
jgi:hypothetical protein